MPEYKETSRYSIPDPTNPTRWRDLTEPATAPEIRVEEVREDTKVYRVLIPAGTHDHGAEFALFVAREQTPMDSSWTGHQLPAREIGIVHRIGVGVAPFLCDQRTSDEDIAKVLANAYLHVEVNEHVVVAGSLETLPIGYGVANGPVTNGFAAADATPDRFPLVYTNPIGRWTGTLSFPHRKWLRAALAAEPGAPSGGTASSADTDDDVNDPCKPHSHSAGPCVRLSSHVLVTFYMTGVFGRVVETQ
ncbi:MAG: hypothetical protein AB7S26_29020 [Sandaracinaceae bacterium]